MSDPAASVRILTSNVNLGFDVSRRRFVLPALRQAVREAGADIVFLQEILGEHRGHARRHAGWPTQPQHEYLADSIWPHHAYGRNAVLAGGHQGNALLSKFEIIAYENRDVSVRGHEPRGLLHGVLALPGRAVPLHAINVHLGLRESDRRHQVALLCAIVEAEIPPDAPLIVAGDFNDWRGRAHAALEATGLHEIFVRGWGRLARTFPASLPVLPLDRIYVRNASARRLAVLSQRPWSRLSDHAALYADIAIAA